MQSNVYIYFSYLHGEYIVAPKRFILDGTMFDDETAYAKIKIFYLTKFTYDKH